MRFNSLSYFIKEGFGGIFKNKLMSFASIAVVCACILIMSFSYCVLRNLNHMLAELEDTIGVAVFLDDDITSDEIAKLSEDIKKIPHVSKVTFVSPDEALSELTADWGVDAEILDGFTGENNPLSNSFEIEMDDITYQGDVIAALQNTEGIRNIRHAQSQTDILIKAENVLKYVGIIVIAVLAAISVVIIMNTIKLSVYTRKSEINIMKYVGATDWFIRWPFIIEGVIMGIIGAIIPMAISWFLYDKVIGMIQSYIMFSLTSFVHSIDIFSVLFPAAILSGILLGVIGSVTSIHKHLQV